MTKYAWLKILEDLEDQHINFAQKLLAIQFLSMEGFHNTLLQTKIPSRKINIGLQVIHDRDHWILASTVRSHPGVVEICQNTYYSCINK